MSSEDTGPLQEQNEEPSKEVSIDVDGNTHPRVQIDVTHFSRFADLLIEAFFGARIKDDAPEDARKEILDQVRVLALLRGIDEMSNDMFKSQDGMGGVLAGYNLTARERMQTYANAMYSIERRGEDFENPGDRALLDWFHEIGIVHTKVVEPEPVVQSEKLIKGLAMMLGIPEDQVEATFAAARDGKPTPGCGCDRCNELRAQSLEEMAETAGDVIPDEPPTSFTRGDNPDVN